MVLIESVFLLKQSFYRDIHINIFKNSPGFTIINIDVAVSIRVASIAITNVPVDPISALTVDTRVWSTFININLTQLSSIPRHAFTWVAILLWDTSCTICALVSKAAVNYGLTASTYHIEEEKGEKSLLTDLFQLKHLFSYNLIIISYFRVISCFNFFWPVKPVMTSSGCALDHVTDTEKMQRLPAKWVYWDFFIYLII